MYLKIGWEGFSINMQKIFYNLSIILPAMDETYSLVQTADIIKYISHKKDIFLIWVGFPLLPAKLLHCIMES